MNVDGPEQPRVLLVDDDTLVLRATSHVLASRYALTCAKSIDEALAELERRMFAAMISDLDLREDRDGLWLLGEVAQRWPTTRRVLLTGLSVEEGDPRLGAIHRLAHKPVAASALLALVAEELAAG